jgi:squalene synthase HpnC
MVCAAPNDAGHCDKAALRSISNRSGCSGRAGHPVFVALAETIREFQIPADPFLDLLAAFRQDQRQTRYETADDVLGYCRCSANPVGRLVLYLARCHTPDRTVLSDMICSGLQLANFCQDVARDWDRGRIYLPLVECRRFGYDEADFAQRRCNEAFCQALAGQVKLAEVYLGAGRVLAPMMPRPWRLPVALFAASGLATLDAIRWRDYDVWTRRPTIGRCTKLRLMLDCWWKVHFRR